MHGIIVCFVCHLHVLIMHNNKLNGQISRFLKVYVYVFQNHVKGVVNGEILYVKMR